MNACSPRSCQVEFSRSTRPGEVGVAQLAAWAVVMVSLPDDVDDPANVAPLTWVVKRKSESWRGFDGHSRIRRRHRFYEERSGSRVQAERRVRYTSVVKYLSPESTMSVTTVAPGP